MNKLKNYLPQLRWTPGKGKKGKKSLAQTFISLDSPALPEDAEINSVYRNSISLDPNVTPCDVMEEILSQGAGNSPIEDSEHPETPTEERSSTPASMKPLDDYVSMTKSGIERDQSPSANTPDMHGYLMMSPNKIHSQLFFPSVADSLQAPIAIAPPSDKPRQTTDGYISLDMCSSGKRIASLKLEQEESLSSIRPPSEVPPVLRSKDLFCLESVPPIPTHDHICHERPPYPPLSTKFSNHCSNHVANRRKMHSSHYDSSSSRSPHFLNSDSHRHHHTSFHYFPDRCQPNVRPQNPTLAEYVQCDNNNNHTGCDLCHLESSEHRDERGYYNSLQRRREKHHQSSVSPAGMDNKDLLRRPVPPPIPSSARHHSYANEPRSNSFKRDPLRKAKINADTYNSLGRQFGRKEFEAEILHTHPSNRRGMRKLSLTRRPPGGYSDDTDSLDGSSNNSNEDTGSTSDFPLSEDCCSAPRVVPKKSLAGMFNNGNSRQNVEIKYLQLNLESTSEEISETFPGSKIEPDHISNYRKIDWLKTKALMETMNDRTKVKGT